MEKPNMYDTDAVALIARAYASAMEIYTFSGSLPTEVAERAARVAESHVGLIKKTAKPELLSRLNVETLEAAIEAVRGKGLAPRRRI